MTRTATRKAAPKTARKKRSAPQAAKPMTTIETRVRQYALHTAEIARDRAASLHAGAEKATTAIETAAKKSVTGAARVSREVQSAVYHDAKSAIVAFEEAVSAKSLREAAKVNVDFLRAQSRVNVARAKSAAEYLSRTVRNGVSSARDNVGKLAPKAIKAA